MLRTRMVKHREEEISRVEPSAIMNSFAVGTAKTQAVLRGIQKKEITPNSKLPTTMGDEGL